MNKAVKIILNILIVVAAIGLFISLILLGESIKYANREQEDPVETEISVFEYDLRHKAYGEVLRGYYVDRLDNYEAPAGMEDIYNVSEYAHYSFMSRVYEEKGDKAKLAANAEKLAGLRNQLGAYSYTADEVDAIIRNAP